MRQTIYTYTSYEIYNFYLKIISQTWLILVTTQNKITLVGKTFFRFLLKFKVILIVLTVLSPKMTTKFPCHPTIFKKKRLNLKTTFVTLFK